MEKISNNDLRKMLLVVVIFGSVFSGIYVIIVDSYNFPVPLSLNFQIFQQLLFSQGDTTSNKNHGTLGKSIAVNITTDVLMNDVEKRVKKKSETNALKTASEKQDSPQVTMQSKTKLLDVSKSNNTTKTRSSKKKCLFNKDQHGPVHVDTSKSDLTKLKMSELDFVQPGGQWEPKNCSAREELAIVIPYRNREEHLGIFLRHMHKFLKSQMLKYRIFVIEQDDEYKFNRGKLMNVGFKEALKRHPFKCFAFHDIDLMPEDSRNDYGCPSSPRHMSVAIDKYDYRLLYAALFGGVEMFKTDDYQKVNGFSNSFWGWGGEDDNLYFRVTQFSKLSRPAIEVARYKMLKHVSMEPFADESRHSRLQQSKNMEYVKKDGLNSLQYNVIRSLDLPLFTLIKVNLNKHKDKIIGTDEYF